MRLLRWGFGAVVGLVALLTGLLMIIMAAVYPEMPPLIRWAAGHPEWVMPLGILVFGAVILWVLSLFTRGPGEAEIRFPGEMGDVAIRLSAIQNFLVHALRVLTEMDVARCQVRLVQNRPHVFLSCRIPVGRSAVVVAQEVQQKIRAAFREDLGLGDLDHIEVQIVEFIPRETGPGRGPTSSITVNGPPNL